MVTSTVADPERRRTIERQLAELRAMAAAPGAPREAAAEVEALAAVFAELFGARDAREEIAASHDEARAALGSGDLDRALDLVVGAAAQLGRERRREEGLARRIDRLDDRQRCRLRGYVPVRVAMLRRSYRRRERRFTARRSPRRSTAGPDDGEPPPANCTRPVAS